VNVALTASDTVPGFGSILNEKDVAESGTPEMVMSPMNGVDPSEKDSTEGSDDGASAGPRPTALSEIPTRAKPATSAIAIRGDLLITS
jgi:hypothetical protein